MGRWRPFSFFRIGSAYSARKLLSFGKRLQAGRGVNSVKQGENLLFSPCNPLMLRQNKIFSVERLSFCYHFAPPFMPKMRRFQSVTTTKKDILAEKLALCEKKHTFFCKSLVVSKKSITFASFKLTYTRQSIVLLPATAAFLLAGEQILVYYRIPRANVVMASRPCVNGLNNG